MGKNKNVIHNGVTMSFDEYDISRADFKEAVEAGIAEAYRYGGPNLPDNTIDELRRIAATATEMDAMAWKCRNSCGCPMTYAGVVTVFEGEGPGSEQAIESAPNKFATGYDRAIAKVIGHEDPVRLHIS